MEELLFFDIYPISFDEFVRYKKYEKFLKNSQSEFKFNKLKNLFEEYLIFWWISRYNFRKKIMKKKIVKLNSLVNSYLLKEIKEILQIDNIIEYGTLLNLLATMDGSLLNINNISSKITIIGGRNKISNMVDILEKTGIIEIVRPILKNKIKELIKTPKFYFSDLGFKNSLINNFNKLSYRENKGIIYENFVLSQLIRQNFKVKFFRFENKFEMDFVIEKDGKIFGIEIKSKLTNDNFSKSLKKFNKIIKPNKIFIYNENIYSTNKNIIFTNYFNNLKIDFENKNEKLFFV